MYNVLIKEVGVGIPYQKVKRFRTYKKAHRFIGHELWKENPNFHWSYSLKYLQDGYEKKKIFMFGDNFVRRNNKCYRILED